MSDLITLIPFADPHIEQTFTWINEPELRRMFLMRGDPTWDVHVVYCHKLMADPTQTVFAIYLDGIHAGNCGFKNIISGQEGELWIYMGSPLVRGKGVGSAATRLLLEQGFKNLNLRLIYLHVADFNLAAINMYKKFGFLEMPMRGESTDWIGRDCTILRMELARG